MSNFTVLALLVPIAVLVYMQLQKSLAGIPEQNQPEPQEETIPMLWNATALMEYPEFQINEYYETLNFEQFSRDSISLYEQMKSCPDGISDILNINEIVQKFVNLKLKWRIIIENGQNLADDVLRKSIHFRECKSQLIGLEREFMLLSEQINEHFKQVYKSEQNYTIIVDSLLNKENQMLDIVNMKNVQLLTFEQNVNETQIFEQLDHISSDDETNIKKRIADLIMQKELQEKNQEKDHVELEKLQFQIDQATVELTILRVKIQELQIKNRLDILRLKEKFKQMEIWNQIEVIGNQVNAKQIQNLKHSMNERIDLVETTTVPSLNNQLVDNLITDISQFQNVMEQLIKVKYETYLNGKKSLDFQREPYDHKIRVTIQQQIANHNKLNELQDKYNQLKKNIDDKESEYQLTLEQLEQLEQELWRLQQMQSNSGAIHKELKDKYKIIHDQIDIMYTGFITFEQFMELLGNDIMLKHMYIYQIMSQNLKIAQKAVKYFEILKEINTKGQHCFEVYDNIYSLKNSSNDLYTSLDSTSQQIIDNQNKIFDSINEIYLSSKRNIRMEILED